MSFTAPTSGTYKGLLFYQDPRVTWASNNGSQLTASSTSHVSGDPILPVDRPDLRRQQFEFQSGPGYTVLIGYNIKIAGNAQVNADYSSLDWRTQSLANGRVCGIKPGEISTTRTARLAASLLHSRR